jgi:predicted nucleic acid-binding protein
MEEIGVFAFRAAGAETIVSSDKDLLVLHPQCGIRILTLASYLAVC